MSWWGKLVGSAFGYMIGGPIGALLGVALGHSFDRGFSDVIQEAIEEEAKESTDRTKTAFFVATFSVMGHIAKSDGRVTEDEIAIARQVMDQMQLSEVQRKVAIRLFNEGKQTDFPLQAVLGQLKKECHRRYTLLQLFLELQIATVIADGVVHEQEQQLLISVGMYLGFTVESINRLISMVQAQSHSANENGFRDYTKKDSVQNAYEVLGLTKHSDDATIKKTYRRLMNQHHPDKLVAKGLPEEMIKVATEKTQEIKKAYEQIKRARGIK